MFKNIKYIFIKNKLKDFVKNEQDICKRAKGKFSNDIDDNLNILDKKAKTFTTTLLNFIDKKNISDVECYKKANIDRKLFSKIRSNPDYKPSKNTVFAFAIALKLDLLETEELLSSAGYSLSHSFITDIIIEYFINKKIYDINLINIALNDYKQQPLGSL